MKKILVPTDFSPASNNAGDYAVALAKELEADVHLLHVYMEPLPVGNVPDYRGISPNTVHAENAVLVSKEVARLQETHRVPVIGNLAVGFKGDSIRDIAGEIGADLLVMGMKADRKMRIFGSTVTRMIRKTSLPVLVVSEAASFRPIKKIVLAIDSRGTFTSFGFALLMQLIKKFDAFISVVHVEEKGAEMNTSEIAAKLQMGRLLSGFRFSYEHMEYDNVDAGILDYVNSHPTDLLVMVAHRHSIFERLFSTVHTTALSFEIRMPLLVLKSHSLFG